MTISNLLSNWSKYRHDHPVHDDGHNPDWPAYPSEIKWAMTIDLDACIGCNACSVACYAENNLPVVGKERYLHGQSMHWMRIERYWGETNVDERYNPKAEYQIVEQDFQVDQGAQFLPMLCQQCEAAPCETVCPVGATNHTEDGLNSQIYNRCIGSRYCSANCPYKVRYFNWYNYPEQEEAWPEPLNQQLNPDLTVRTKGVMEKCTFCKQRTYEARNRAKTEGRAVTDSDVQTACQQACPTSAISFGDLKNPESLVAKQWKNQRVELQKDKQDKDEEPDNKLRGYRVLEELRPYPSVMYLERVRESTV